VRAYSGILYRTSSRSLTPSLTRIDDGNGAHVDDIEAPNLHRAAIKGYRLFTAIDLPIFHAA
jgi:hypothetical protein